MPNSIEIKPTGPIHGTIRPPGSKSLTNRALVCAAMAEGETVLQGALDSEDTRVMIGALRQLAIPVDVDLAARTVRVAGCGGRLPTAGGNIDVANSGTTMRFLAAMVAAGHGVFRLDGIDRMRERPIRDLLDALAQLGVDAQSELGTGCPPIVIRAAGLRGGTAAIRGEVSSQFLSGLLMAAPHAAGPVELIVEGTLVSKPYIQMTLAVMEAFGVPVQSQALSTFRIPNNRRYRGRVYAIEPDASAASYFFGAAAVSGGRVTVEGLSRHSLQGDVAFCDCLARMGCEVRYEADRITVTGKPLRGIEADMNAVSDTVQTLAAVALTAKGPTTIRGVAHIRHKETDRIGNLAAELRKLGATVEEHPDGLRIIPGPLHGARIETYNDHRMAMSLALVGLMTPGVVILDPGCTVKTYPEFFADLAALAQGRQRVT